ncbi:hypothetical protein OAF52_02280 [bacterium]|nr:hypothetical protein [bacterium]
MSQSVKLIEVQGLKKIYAQFIEKGLGFSTGHAISKAALTGGVWFGSALGQAWDKREGDSLRVDTTLRHLANCAFFVANRSESTQRLGLK